MLSEVISRATIKTNKTPRPNEQVHAVAKDSVLEKAACVGGHCRAASPDAHCSSRLNVEFNGQRYPFRLPSPSSFPLVLTENTYRSHCSRKCVPYCLLAEGFLLQPPLRALVSSPIPTAGICLLPANNATIQILLGNLPLDLAVTIHPSSPPPICLCLQYDECKTCGQNTVYGVLQYGVKENRTLTQLCTSGHT